MSVRVVDRQPSPIQILDDAEKLKDLVIERMNCFVKRLNKKYKYCKYEAQNVAYEAYQAPIKLAFDGWMKLKEAFEIWIKTKEDFEVKKLLFKQSIEIYKKIPLYYGALYKHFRRYNLIKEHTCLILNQKIDNLIDKINKQIKIDKNYL